MLAIYNSRGY